MLVVADLHLEKGSAYGARRQFLPPYDTAATLGRLAAVVGRHAPRLVVALGDSFHDRRAAARLQPGDLDALRALQAGRDWLWLAGNHDPDPVPTLGGDHAPAWSFGPLRFRHEPEAGAARGEVAGHLHPVALVAGRGGTARRRAFVGDGQRCVMPAFGAYAGGLNLHDPAFARLFAPGTRTAYALGRTRVYSIPEHRCLADR